MELTKIGSVPRGLFQGNNMMTSEFLGYYKGTIGGRTVYLEVSAENSPYWQAQVERKSNPKRLIGLTFRRADGGRLDPDPSTCVAGLREAEDLLELPRMFLGSPHPYD